MEDNTIIESSMVNSPSKTIPQETFGDFEKYNIVFEYMITPYGLKATINPNFWKNIKSHDFGALSGVNMMRPFVFLSFNHSKKIILTPYHLSLI